VNCGVVRSYWYAPYEEEEEDDDEADATAAPGNEPKPEFGGAKAAERRATAAIMTGCRLRRGNSDDDPDDPDRRDSPRRLRLALVSLLPASAAPTIMLLSSRGRLTARESPKAAPSKGLPVEEGAVRSDRAARCIKNGNT
jgi:hypothetical protein